MGDDSLNRFSARLAYTQSRAKQSNVFIRIFATQARDSLLCSVMKCNKYPFIASIFVWIGYFMALASSQLKYILLQY